MNKQRGRELPGRRWLSIGVFFVLLVGLFYRPLSPTLVCRATGRAMTPVYTASEPSTGRSCCKIHAVPHGYALSAPGCCDLRQSNGAKNTVAVPFSPQPVPEAFLFPLLKATAPVFATLPVRGRFWQLPFFARPPPGGTVSLRAPPVPRRLA